MILKMTGTRRNISGCFTVDTTGAANATSCACHKKVRLSVHREARYGERSERNDLPEAGLQGDFFYGHFEWIRYIM